MKNIKIAYNLARLWLCFVGLLVGSFFSYALYMSPVLRIVLSGLLGVVATVFAVGFMTSADLRREYRQAINQRRTSR